jgi:biotin synthase
MEIEIISKPLDDTPINAEEIAHLFRVPLFSRESAMILSAAREKSERVSSGLAEVHAQVGLNAASCPNNCMFCALATKNKVFTEPIELTVKEAVNQAERFEKGGVSLPHKASCRNDDAYIVAVWLV